MLIERTADEVIIRLSSSVNTDDLQDVLNYLRYKELTSEMKVDQEDIDIFASEVNKSWWTENRSRLVK